MNWETTKTRHGTHSGWSRHQLLDEEPCDMCREARSRYDQSRSDASKQARRFAARVQSAAKTELVRRHKAEYDEIYRTLKEQMSEEWTSHD